MIKIQKYRYFGLQKKYFTIHNMKKTGYYCVGDYIRKYYFSLTRDFIVTIAGCILWLDFLRDGVYFSAMAIL